MGLEGACQRRLDNLSANAKVLLEARDLILYAQLRRTIKLAQGVRRRRNRRSAAISRRVTGHRFGTWRRSYRDISNENNDSATSLGQKLGIGHASTAFVIGTIDEPALVEALDDHVADSSLAALSLAIVRDDQDLVHELTLHEAAMGKAPIWIVHGQGQSAPFGKTLVHKPMRERGYRDTKVSAVSTALSNTRYSSG